MKTKDTGLRELPSFIFAEHRLPDEFRLFVKHRILSELYLTGCKIDQKKLLATQIIHNLVETGLTSSCVADSRDWNVASVRIPIWDHIVEAGYARVCVGSESSGKVTRYRATGRLLDQRCWQVGQKKVERWAWTIRWTSWPQVGHGLPARS